MRSSRRQFLARSAQFGVLLGAGLPVLQSCGGGDSSSNGAQEPIADGLTPESGPLRIFNYPDYVNPEVIADFENKYGVKVEITTFDTDTEALTKLASGAVKVDFHHSISTNTIGRVIAGGLIQPLNKSYLPNLANIQPAFKDPYYDKGGVYSAPYTIFATGIGYRADRIDPAVVEELGWNLLWQPEYKGTVSILDEYRESPAMAMLRKGLTDVNTSDRAVIEQSGADLSELIDLVNVKVNIEGYKDVPEGVTNVAHTWSADMLTGALGYLPEGVGPEVLGFWYPSDDVGVVNNDCMGVLADAEHPVLAHLYLDYILDLAVSEKNFSLNGYLPALTGLDADYLVAQGYVPENLRRCVLSEAQIQKGLRFLELDTETDLLWEDTWSKFTAGG
jgi:spermidine/putrescine transport system substrate-binding protein